jgi:hypothetical protein
MNAAINDVETALVGLNLGVTASVELSRGNLLVFRMFERKWCLTVQNTEDEDMHTQRLFTCNRETRLAVVKALPSLAATLIDSAQNSLSIVEDAAMQTRGLAARIRMGAKP